MIVTREVTGSEPVSLADMKAYLRVFHTEEDAKITAMITEARKMLEYMTGLSLVEQTVTIKTEIDGRFKLPFGPVDNILSVTVDDDDVSADVELNSIDDKGTLEASYDAGPYDCEVALKAYVAQMYTDPEKGTMPQITSDWVKANTMNLWLQ
jgi:uncharacterized phiE125 gp8 family phage protein